MNNRLAAALLPCLFVLALFVCVQAFAAETEVNLNDRLVVPANGETHSFTFSSAADNVYTFDAFGSGIAEAELWRVGDTMPIVPATAFPFEARLTVDSSYVLFASSENSSVEIEIMRDTLGRCFEQPIELKGLAAGYDKMIARAYDTHWFRFTAPESGLYIMRSTSQINTVGWLLDEHGQRLAVSDNLYSPYALDFRLQHVLEAEKTYYIRISGRGGDIGAYHLTVAQPTPGQAVPREIQIDLPTLTLEEGQIAKLRYKVVPKGSISDAVWLSSNDSIASVTQDGMVTGHRAGTADIIISGVQGLEARSIVTITAVDVTGLEIDTLQYELHAGESIQLQPRVLPDHTSNRGVEFKTSNPDIAVVDRYGNLTAIAPGEATVNITTQNGEFSLEIYVNILRAKSQYRVLVMGEHSYPAARGLRTGSINTTQGIADLFSQQVYDGIEPVLTMKLDSTRESAIASIREAFKDALPTDVSILYINCHGGITDGEAWLEFHDESKITATQLERIFRRVKGNIVLLIDSCESGSFISTQVSPYYVRQIDNAGISFNRSFVQVFSANSRSRFNFSKYNVLTSTSSAQDSYRFSTDPQKTESSMATLFARSLAEGGGWDLIGDKAVRPRADLDQNGLITLHEAHLFTKRRVNDYLSRSNPRRYQDVQLYPLGATLTLLSKS